MTNTSDEDIIVGIDLGTTNSAIAVVQEAAPRLLPVQGRRILPSVVGISPEGELLVGAAARNQWVVAPERTVRSIKRKMGSNETVTMAGETYSPQEISALILRELKQAAESALGHAVTRAVITVPAYFNEVQRQATVEAGEIAGFVVERIINEPTAAALAYGYGLETEGHLRILVYDLGGGTFDVSLIELDNGIVDVVATAGNNRLGGDDFDERLADLLADEFEEEHGINLREDHRAWARLLRAAEEAKIALSTEPFAQVALEYIAEDERGAALHLEREVSRLELEEEISDLLDDTITLIDQALEAAGWRADDVDRVLLVGGATRTPRVRELVGERMGQPPHMEIDPDAAVALGAAVQGAIIAGQEIDAILVDVTPLSLGIEVAEFSPSGRLIGDRYQPLIQRNTTIPVQRSEVFTTLFPGQKSIRIRVYQGENKVASQNILLGEFMVEDLKPNRPDGLTEVTVNFALDVNGILNVTVTERQRNRRTGAQLRATRQRLSPEQIAQSQAKLAGMPAAVIDDPEILALLQQAEALLEKNELEKTLAEDIRAAMENIRQAIAAGETESDDFAALIDDLADMLLDAELG